MSKHTKAEVEEAKTKLREWMPRGTTVYTILEHVSKSGMSRRIRILVPQILTDGGKHVVRFIHPNHAASVVLGWSRKERAEGITVAGCGMDMGFHLVYSLSSALYGDGYALKQEWI